LVLGGDKDDPLEVPNRSAIKPMGRAVVQLLVDTAAVNAGHLGAMKALALPATMTSFIKIFMVFFFFFFFFFFQSGEFTRMFDSSKKIGGWTGKMRAG
jgi:hypothetical protein